MAYLSYIEKETICRIFGIADGYVFKYWSDRGKYNKTKTKDLILDTCSINIFDDDGYKGLSQEKCIRKIWNEGTPQMIANLLEGLSKYFCFGMGTDCWESEDKYDYNQVQDIIKRLRTTNFIELPQQGTTDNISIILEDIENNLRNQKPELVIDRLHTFACEYLRKLCTKHHISVVGENGEEFPTHSLIGMLRKWYEDNDYCETEFSLVAIKNSISLFEKFNHVRNEHSAAHPNELLSKAEAEYIVKIMAATLMFLENIENKHDQKTMPWDGGVLYLDLDSELPF